MTINIPDLKRLAEAELYEGRRYADFDAAAVLELIARLEWAEAALDEIAELDDVDEYGRDWEEIHSMQADMFHKSQDIARAARAASEEAT